MSMTNHRDRLGRLVQEGGACGVRLVRIAALDECNRYDAHLLGFDEQGAPQVDDGPTLTVTNLAEPADQDGQLAEGADAVALDVEGRWVIFVQPAPPSAVFPARVTQSQGSATYLVREQQFDSGGSLGDKPDAADIAAQNLPELTLGPGSAVDIGTIVQVTAVPDAGTPPTLRYFFDHPAYAKYLD